MSDGPSLAFVLLERPEAPDPAALCEAAAEFGFTLSAGEAPPDGPQVFDIEGGGTLFIMLMPGPHPDAAQMPTGLMSPGPEDLERMSAHYIVTAMGLPADPKVADPMMAAFTAAAVKASPAIAAMLGTGVVFHKADFFTGAVADAQGALPMLVCVDVTAAPEPEERMSFLTHGLARYGREEFYLTAPRTGQGALDFLLSLVGWMLDDPDKQLPTGETVGRSAEEKVFIQREDSPLGEGPQVIRLDLAQ